MWWWSPKNSDQQQNEAIGPSGRSQPSIYQNQDVAKSEMSLGYSKSSDSLRKLTAQPAKGWYWRWGKPNEPVEQGSEATGETEPEKKPGQSPKAAAVLPQSGKEPVPDVAPGTAEPPSGTKTGTPPSTAPAPSRWSFWPKRNDKLVESRIDTIVVPTFSQSFAPQSLLTKLWTKTPYQISPPRIRKAVVIGVHGYFPAKLSRTFLGEPTGTSIKFATEGAAMLEDWAKSTHQTIEIERIALEGEGLIAQREETLYNLLKNSLDVLQRADFIFFAVHSQGAVVGIHLIARLLEEYKVRARIGLLAMAGACLGPMPGMDQTIVGKAIGAIEHASLSELFELQNPASLQSQKFLADISRVLEHGVKLVFIAAADDQLVPLYSALCIHIDHPNIFRAVYLDNELASAPVIAPLLELAVRRRNMGVPDYDFLKEISKSLAGALTGNGHSRLYGSDKVYGLSLKTMLETCCFYTKPKVHEFRLPRRNPYVLPWSLHAILNDPPSSLRPTVTRLFDEYARWRPESKPMRELRYRLGALKAKL